MDPRSGARFLIAAGQSCERVVTKEPSSVACDDVFRETPVFPGASRLADGADFDLVFKQPARSSDRFFTVLYRGNDLGYPRIGLAIAKKRVRRAVARNRLKRIIRDSFRHAKNQLLGADIVIMARDRTELAENKELFSSLEKHWRAVARSNRSV